MANYFKGTFKSFGLVRIIVVSILFGLLSIPLFWILKENAYYENFYAMAFYLPVCILMLLSCAGVVSIKNEEVDFYDCLRVVGFLGSLVTFIVSLFFIGFNGFTFVLALGTMLICAVEIFVRSKKDLIENENGAKSFYEMSYKPGLLCLVVIGLLIGALVSICLKDSDIVAKNFYVAILVFVAYLLVYFVVSLIVKKKNILDDITLVFLGFVVSFLADNTSVFTTLESQALLLVLMLGSVEFSLRVCLATKNENKRYPNYYSYLGKNIDLGLPHLVGALAVVAICGGSFVTMLNPDADTSKFGINGVNYFVILIAALSVVAFISLVIKCKLKNGKNVSRTDRALYSIVLIGIIVTVYSIYNLYTGGFKLDNISASDFVLYATGYVDLALGILLTCVRIEDFNSAKEEQIEEAETEELEDTEESIDEETEETEENVEDETTDEVSEEEVTEDEEETVESTSNEEENIETDDEFEQFINTLSEKEETTSENTEEVKETEEEASDEESDEEESEDEEDESEDSIEEEQAEESAEESDEEAAEEENPIANVEVKQIETFDSEGNKKVIKKKFTTKMMFAPYETKQYYSEIKNYLTKYRCKGRATTACESFRYKGLVAKLAILGKTLKVYLALDPAEFEGTKYRVKDASNRKRYSEVPCLLKIKSNRALKYCKELIDLIMERKEVKPKRNFEEVDYTSNLIPNGEAILTSIGFASDYISDSVSMKSSFVHDLPDDLENYIPVVQGEPLEEDEVQVTVCLDTLCNHFNDGDSVSLDILKSMGLIATGNTLRVRARGTLDKKLTIYADIFDPLALKMLMCRNCTAVKIER